MVLTYTHLGTEPLSIVIVVNVIMFLGIFSRMIPYQALVTSVPEPVKRGSFNAVNSAVQQLGGGVASLVAGHLVSAGPGGELHGMPAVGYVVVGTTLIAAGLVWCIHLSVQKRMLSLAYVSTPLPETAATRGQ
jgi:predicted MFS family arabinose efflux permease